jgi:hypothetical protein
MKEVKPCKACKIWTEHINDVCTLCPKEEVQ